MGKGGVINPKKIVDVVYGWSPTSVVWTIFFFINFFLNFSDLDEWCYFCVAGRLIISLIYVRGYLEK